MTEEEQQVYARVQEHLEDDSRRWVIMAWAIIILFIILAVVAIGGAITIQKVEKNTNAIKVNAIRSRDADRRNASRNHIADDHIAFRLCQRDSVNRAFAQSFSLHNPQRLKEIQRRLPILDCEPNIDGKPAKAIPYKQQTAFVKRFVRNELTAKEQGICIRDVRDAVC